MPFENELISREDFKFFVERKKQKNVAPIINIESYVWTINREENVFLVLAGYNSGDMDEKFFVLSWNSVPLEVKLREIWIDEFTLKWKLEYLQLAPEFADKGNKIVKSLKDALTTYGFNGDPDDLINKNMKVKFDF
ncbi:MAG: hypothetical protein EOM05_04585 [Clostridia bacterium]|nr:hypothetical protein [Clostridia bacterium]